MKTGRFFYEVKIEVELTGLDLTILEYHAKRHYDDTCQSFFKPARDIRDPYHEGYAWVNQWRWVDWKARFGHLKDKRMEDGELRHPSENPEQPIAVTVTSSQLDLCMKILERLGAADVWALVEAMTGRKMPVIEQQMNQLVAPLRVSILDAFFKIQEEWKRLDEERIARDLIKAVEQ